MLIREMGNCGDRAKLERIMDALDAAIKYKTKVVLVLDTLVYGDNLHVFESGTIQDYKFNHCTLFIGDSQFPWWDITKVNLVF